jgi:hypothetical protein
VNIKLSTDWTIADQLPDRQGPFIAVMEGSPVPLLATFNLETLDWYQIFQKKGRKGGIILESTLLEEKVLAYRSISGISIEFESDDEAEEFR